MVLCLQAEQAGLVNAPLSCFHRALAIELPFRRRYHALALDVDLPRAGVFAVRRHLDQFAVTQQQYRAGQRLLAGCLMGDAGLDLLLALAAASDLVFHHAEWNE